MNRNPLNTAVVDLLSAKGALVASHAPALCGSLVITELFYKLHSFTLEAVAFLATWFVLDVTVSLLVSGASRIGRS